MDAGSTVANNTHSGFADDGIAVTCPSNVIGNTAVGSDFRNLSLSGAGCNSVDNLAPPTP